MTATEVGTGTGRRGGPTALMATLVLVVVVVAIVSSLGAPLVPEIADSRGVSLGTAQWTLTVTLLTGAVSTPVLGRLGDGPRRRQVILVTLGLVALGCGLAVPGTSLWVLLCGRALQGLGLGLMPLAMAVARDHLGEGRVRRAVMLLSITTVAGAGIGYPISGALSAVAGVGASFVFGGIVVCSALVLAAVVLPHGTHLPPRRLDLAGALLLGAGLAAALLAVSRGQQWGWSSATVLALLASALVLLTGWTVHELRTPIPLVELGLLRNRAVLLADVTAVAAGTGTYLLMSVVSWLLQSPGTGDGAGFGRGPLVAACAMVPFSVCSVATARVVPRLLARYDDVWLMPLGCLFFALSMVGLGLFRDTTAAVFAIMAVGGIGAGCTFSAMPSIIVAAVPRHEVGSAIGFNQVLRSVGYSTGSAASAAVLAAYVVPGTATTSAEGYDAAAVLGFGVFVLAALVSLVLGLLPHAAHRQRQATEGLMVAPEP